MVDISFKNITGKVPTKLSAIIGADSFFYGQFDDSNTLLEAQYYTDVDYGNPLFVTKVEEEVYNIANLPSKVAYAGKPYLHLNKEDADGNLLSFFPAFDKKRLLEDKLTDQDTYVDYGMSVDMTSFVNKVLGANHKLYHLSTVLDNQYYPYYRPQLVALIDMDLIHLLHGKMGNMTYYNQFKCNSEEDYLYFVLSAYKTLGLDLEIDPLVLSGRIELDGSIYRTLEGYVRHVNLEYTALFEVSDLRFKSSKHYYHDLFSTILCE